MEIIINTIGLLLSTSYAFQIHIDEENFIKLKRHDNGKSRHSEVSINVRKIKYLLLYIVGILLQIVAILMVFARKGVV